MPSTRRRSIPLTLLVGLLQGVAGLGALIAGFGFVVMTARLTAAELPVVEGLELFGVRTVIATGARSLAILPLVAFVLLLFAPLAAVWGRIRDPREPKSNAYLQRRIVFVMSVVALFIVLAVVTIAIGHWGTDAARVALAISLALVAGGLVWLYRLLKRHRPPPAIVLALIPMPLMAITILTMPMMFGLLVLLVFSAISWYLRPGVAPRLDRLRDLPPTTLERTIAAVAVVLIITGYAVYAAITPPTVFTLAIVKLSDGRQIAGAFVGRSADEVWLARCDADVQTVEDVDLRGLDPRALARARRERAFSRNARFLRLPAARIRSLRIKNRSYIFNPGRSRTVLGAIVAVADQGPDLGYGAPLTVRVNSYSPRPVCGG
jgi:hypothetical protein